MATTIILSPDLARKLIAEQFPEYASLPIVDVEKQGHDNRTYRLGEHMLIRMPTAADYALKVPKEQELLPQLAKRLSVSIPAPIKMGKPSADYPYPPQLNHAVHALKILLKQAQALHLTRLCLFLHKC